jgi:hypothetical protein
MSKGLFGKTWKLDQGPSIFTVGFNPTSETRLYEKLDNGYKLTVSGTEGGKPYSWNYTAFYDGKRHPVTGRSDVDSIEIYELSEYRTAGFFYLGDQPAGAYNRKVEASASELVVEAAGRRPGGGAYYDVINYKL